MADRTKQVWIRVTEDEHARLAELARRDSERLTMRVTVADLVRREILNMLKRRDVPAR